MMESSSPTPDPVQAARDDLAVAQDAQRQVGRDLHYGRADEVIYAAAVGLTVLASGLGGAIELEVSGLWLRILVPVIYVVALALLAWGYVRFKATNGVWVSGFSPRRSRWVSVALVIVLGALTLAAAYAGSEGLWGLLALASVAGAAFGFGLGRLWLHVYRRETAAGPRG